MTIHAEDLRRYLAEATGRPVSLKMNDNLHTLVSSKRDGAGPGLKVSVHRMFLEADDKILDALARFIHQPDDGARQAIREFINSNRERIVEARSVATPREVKGTFKGRFANLQVRSKLINEEYFRGSLEFKAIIWGKGVRAGRTQRHVTLGTWNDRQKIIRIHPMLDHPHVPEYFRDFVIYHEMVHIAIPSEVNGHGTMVHHSPEFRAMEQGFRHYAMAMRWEQRWLPYLIREWNGGRGLPAAAAR